MTFSVGTTPFVFVLSDVFVLIVAKICQRAEQDLTIKKQVRPFAFGEGLVQVMSHAGYYLATGQVHAPH
jgi:hypothetical protein